MRNEHNASTPTTSDMSAARRAVRVLRWARNLVLVAALSGLVSVVVPVSTDLWGAGQAWPLPHPMLTLMLAGLALAPVVGAVGVTLTHRAERVLGGSGETTAEVARVWLGITAAAATMLTLLAVPFTVTESAGSASLTVLWVLTAVTWLIVAVLIASVVRLAMSSRVGAA